MFWRRGAYFLALLLWVLAPLPVSADPVTLELIRRVVLLEKMKARYGIPLSPAEVAEIERVKEWNFENTSLINEGQLSSGRREWVEQYQRWVAEDLDPSRAEVADAFWASPRTVMTPKFLRAGGLEEAAKSLGVRSESLEQAVRSSVLLTWPAHLANAVHIGPGLFLTNAHVAKAIPQFLGIAHLESNLSVQRASVEATVLFADPTLDLAVIQANVPKDSFLAGESAIHFSENDDPALKTVSFSLTATVLENGKNGVVPLMSVGTVGGVGGFYDSHALCTSGQSGSPVFEIAQGEVRLFGLLSASGVTEANHGVASMEFLRSSEKLGEALAQSHSIVTGVGNLRRVHGLSEEVLKRGGSFPDSELLANNAAEEWRRLKKLYFEHEEDAPFSLHYALALQVSVLSRYERLSMVLVLRNRNTVGSWLLALDILESFGPEYIFTYRKRFGAEFGWAPQELLGYFRARHLNSIPMARLSDEIIPGKIVVDFNGLDRDQLVNDFVAQMRAERCNRFLENHR